MAAWHEEPINRKHDREAFDCGEEALNEFLRRYARKSHELGGAKTFLAIDDADNNIIGFYSLSPASVDYARTPQIIRRGLARHDVPGFRLARLAVDRKLQGQGIGGQLLLAAGKRKKRGNTDARLDSNPLDFHARLVALHGYLTEEQRSACLKSNGQGLS